MARKTKDSYKFGLYIACIEFQKKGDGQVQNAESDIFLAAPTEKRLPKASTKKIFVLTMMSQLIIISGGRND